MATSRFYTDQKTAHRLSNLKKRNVFYFRTITAFPSDRVYCETTATGYDFIKRNYIPVQWDYNKPSLQC